MVRDLRDRCPWDRAQTRETLRPYLVEEALELDEALGAGDTSAIRSELGDLLLHLAFQMVIAEEAGEFTSGEIADSLEVKMRRRHPHLFGLGDAESWERLKRRERDGTMSGIVPPPAPTAQGSPAPGTRGIRRIRLAERGRAARQGSRGAGGSGDRADAGRRREPGTPE